MAPIYTQYIEERNAFQLIHEISIQDFRSRHREGEDRLGNNHREIITLSVDGRNYLLKISVYDKFRSDIGGRLVVVFLSNMSDDVESFKIAGHMEAECSSGKKKVL